MKTKILIFGMLLLGVIFLLASTSTKSADVAQYKTFEMDTLAKGQELYRLNCASCHGLDRKGILPTFPSLVDIKEKLSKGEIRAQIKYGKGQMPSMAHLSDEEVDIIIAFLYDEAEQEVFITPLTPVKQGEMLFKSNCAGCHRATTSDPVPQNANTQMCSMMEPAVLAGTTKRFTQDQFFDILEAGPCNMPTFSHMKEEEKEALYAYLETLEGKGEPRRSIMGIKHPMMRKGKSFRGI